MTWHLTFRGRVIARGTRAAVLFAAEERDLIETIRCGGHTADPAYMPRLRSREAAIVPVSGRG